ncbi:hypothetical protein ABG768_023150 [Culter alburnus]|uniref:Uncharacterized protein n=1 Tax=Culter alburnus TaxID=194366 RepID=A0AAW2AMW6_CULAL
MNQKRNRINSFTSHMRGPPGHWMSYGHPCTEHAVWNPKFCVVTDYQMLLLDKEEIHPLLLQGNRTDTCKSRLLRRTISVPVETQFPEFQCHLSVDNSESYSRYLTRSYLQLVIFIEASRGGCWLQYSVLLAKDISVSVVFLQF